MSEIVNIAKKSVHERYTWVYLGPTCDSMDIHYEHQTYTMPESARIGDRVYIFTSGAYTQSYSSVYFNGFPPLEVYVLE